MKKSKSKYEYSRQINIAQSAVTWMDQMGIDYTGTRAEDLKKDGITVEQWAKQFERA